MDSVRARSLKEELVGKEIGPWTVTEYINCGKSAAVFKAEGEGRLAALKVFDRELVERYGEGVQLARIEREQVLRGQHHPNLIEILGGGRCRATGYLYVAMAYLPHPNMAELVGAIPRDRIGALIDQVAKAARFLETHGLAHRDIKPDNVAVSPDFSTATLLDLGVVKPLDGLTNITDGDDQLVFVGTLRYSPPELLHREEEDTPDAWRAITFYQLGAVLHDLIVRDRLFKKFSEPFARLADAVRHEQVVFPPTDAPEDLVLLARNCLIKEPALRLKHVQWDDFTPRPLGISAAELAKQRLRRRLADAEAAPRSLREEETEERRRESLRALRQIQQELQAALNHECIGGELQLPPVTIQESQRERPADSVAFIFAVSRSNALRFFEPLYLFFETRLEGAAERIVNIRCAAQLGEPSPSSDPPPERLACVFAGVYEQGAAREKLVSVLYPALDRAMERAEARRDAGQASAPEWLPIEDRECADE